MHSSHSISINSWAELLEVLYKDSWNEKLQKHQSPYVFRALEDRNYRLSSALHRLQDPQAELQILKSYQQYRPQGTANSSFWELLAEAHQLGLPTRLLSWSYSPLVALHFAVANPQKQQLDAVLWAVNYQQARLYWPDQLALMVPEGQPGALACEDLNAMAQNLEDLGKLKRKDYALFIESPLHNMQSRNQALLYSLMSNDHHLMDDWLRSKKVDYFRMVIPARLKQEIRDKLDQANIHEQILFPDTQGLVQWIKRRYQKVEATASNGSSNMTEISSSLNKEL